MKIKAGPPIDRGAILARADGRPEVYLVDRNGKQFVPSVEVFDRYWFAEKRIVILPPIVLDAITSKPDLR